MTDFYNNLIESAYREGWDMIFFKYYIPDNLIYKYLESHPIKSISEKSWIRISTSQKLSEEFMRKYFQYLDKFWISSNQHLSEEFILEYLDRLDIEGILIFQHHLSDDFKSRLSMLVELTDS